MPIVITKDDARAILNVADMPTVMPVFPYYVGSDMRQIANAIQQAPGWKRSLAKNRKYLNTCKAKLGVNHPQVVTASNRLVAAESKLEELNQNVIWGIEQADAAGYLRPVSTGYDINGNTGPDWMDALLIMAIVACTIAAFIVGGPVLAICVALVAAIGLVTASFSELDTLMSTIGGNFGGAIDKLAWLLPLTAIAAFFVFGRKKR